jgi:nicotinate-nucleotide adenylyltransferase
MVGLFGGSFDPVHHGHLIVARAALEALALDEVRFIPAANQPFKSGGHAASGADRVEMVRRAVRGDPKFVVDPCEVERQGVSYTVDTLRHLTGREPGRSFILLLGADAAAGLPKWRESEEVLRMARVAVFARPGEATPAGAWIFATVPAPLIEISATDLRQRVAAGRPIRYYVPDAVAAYVAERGLYKDQ